MDDEVGASLGAAYLRTGGFLGGSDTRLLYRYQTEHGVLCSLGQPHLLWASSPYSQGSKGEPVAHNRVQWEPNEKGSCAIRLFFRKVPSGCLWTMTSWSSTTGFWQQAAG